VSADPQKESVAQVGIVVTRGEGPNGPLSRILMDHGATVIQWGSIAFAPPEDPAPLIEALGDLEKYDWIFFSSPRAVEAVTSRVSSPPPGVRMAVVGPSTGEILREAGWPVDRTPLVASGERMVEAFRVAGDVEGARIFFPASAIARDVFPKGMRALGAEVDQVTAYRMLTLPLDAGACKESLDAGSVQAVTFASPSAMEGLKKGLGAELFQRLADHIPGVAMGATTAGALEGEGWKHIEVAKEPTLEGLAAAALRGAQDNTKK
jgi:uroporphyrinogen-III synthase